MRGAFRNGEKMTRLCQLAEHYKSDKCPAIFHHYTPFYHSLLQNREINRILEIGIGTTRCMNHVPGYKAGGSLRMWRDYYSTAEIVGLDNDPEAMVYQEKNIQTYFCDQSNRGDLAATAFALGGKFDLIIDDGSHLTEHQALTASVFIPMLLSPKGIYIIEDVCFPKELYPLVPWPCEVHFFEPTKVADDCVFVIKGENL